MCFGLPGSSIITRSCNFTIGHDLDKERKVKLALSAKLLYIKHLRKKTKSLKQFYVASLVNASWTTYKAKSGIDLPRWEEGRRNILGGEFSSDDFNLAKRFLAVRISHFMITIVTCFLK